MNIRIAILAACAGTLVLAQPGFVQAASSDAIGSNGLIDATDVRSAPVIVLAQSAPVNTSRSNKKNLRAGEGTAGPKSDLPGAPVSTTRSNKKNQRANDGTSGSKNDLPGAPVVTSRSNKKR